YVVADDGSSTTTSDTWGFITNYSPYVNSIAVSDDYTDTGLIASSTHLDVATSSGIARITEAWFLTTNSETGGSVTEPGEGTFAYEEQGTTVDITASASSSYGFNEWTGDTGTIADTYASSTTITMDDSYSITANFIEPADYCSDPRNYDTTAHYNGDLFYCDDYGRIWTPTANVDGSADTKQWYTSDTDTADSCIGQGADFEACNYCDTLNYAGYEDWELPSCTDDDNLPDSCNLYQFGESACDWTGTDGSEDSCTPSWDDNAQSSYYWSSSEYQDNTDYARYVYFLNGDVYIRNKSGYGYVRCVRGQ
ncbi:MAG: DUF1566 domain-containing protein, partial [Candidatus Paceibacterota bacterium]